jgi:hypothetical protein
VAEAPVPATGRPGELEAFLEGLRDADPQVRLNAAVRLAYLGRAEGLEALLEGLAHESGAIRFHQVPDALALLGDAGDARLQRLVGRPGPARLGAARALFLRGRLAGVPEAVAALLGEPDRATRWTAAALAGEIGPSAGAAAAALRQALQEGGAEIAIGNQALAAVAGTAALLALRQELEHPAAARRSAAMRGLSGLGAAAASAAAPLLRAVEDGQRSLGERLTAAHALTRVSPSGDGLLAALLGVLPRADRWLTIGLLRTMARLGPEYPLRPEESQQWPAWESRLAHRVPAAKVDSSRGALLRTLAEHVGHPDYDVRRAAGLGLAFFGRAAGSAAPAVRAAPLSEALRHDVLRRLGEPSQLDPAGFPWDLTMAQPELDLDAVAAACEALWARAAGGPLDHPLPVPKWAFLQYLVDHHGLLLHGSHTAGIDVLRPVSHSWGGGRISDQPGVFAVGHALMAMYFGTMDRTKVPNLSNGLYQLTAPDSTTLPGFHLATDFVALSGRPFVEATVYVLPPDTFSMLGELTSLVPVRPLASVPIEPQDFPLLEDLWGSDLGPLSAQFTRDGYPALRDVGLWASKRSARSAER